MQVVAAEIDDVAFLNCPGKQGGQQKTKGDQGEGKNQGDPHALTGNGTDAVPVAGAIGFRGQHADHRQHAHQNSQNIEHDAAGKTDRGKFDHPEPADDSHVGHHHAELGQVGAGQRQPQTHDLPELAACRRDLGCTVAGFLCHASKMCR